MSQGTCSNCYHPLQIGELRCSHCGHGQTSTVQQPTQSTSYDQYGFGFAQSPQYGPPLATQPISTAPKKSSTCLWITIVTIAASLALCGGCALLTVASGGRFSILSFQFGNTTPETLEDTQPSTQKNPYNSRNTRLVLTDALTSARNWPDQEATSWLTFVVILGVLFSFPLLP